ncbi:MAG: hypothetical protein KIT84_38390 [Labilithrix sp.]|nr:hypothetical protein [Labilithrix sp.]MCW5816930.1 hypothetical protein [Labilithrix sp.]
MRAKLAGVLILAGCLAFAAAATGDDRSTAEATLKEVAASPKKDVANEYVTRSRAALERGAQLRTKGDEAHARLADAVAKRWADAARDAAKAAVVEESAVTARLRATDAGLVSDRERALLEEAVAQSGRLRAQLEAAPGKEKEQPARTSAAANITDGGAPKPKAAPARDAGGAQ